MPLQSTPTSGCCGVRNGADSLQAQRVGRPGSEPSLELVPFSDLRADFSDMRVDDRLTHSTVQPGYLAIKCRWADPEPAGRECAVALRALQRPADRLVLGPAHGIGKCRDRFILQSLSVALHEKLG
jgi:hypothetical protein